MGSDLINKNLQQEELFELDNNASETHVAPCGEAVSHAESHEDDLTIDQEVTPTSNDDSNNASPISTSFSNENYSTHTESEDIHLARATRARTQPLRFNDYEVELWYQCKISCSVS